jgi:CRP/FNR family cyclic AMP-dependent transcriptional regulator
VLSGTVRVSTSSKDGKEVILNLIVESEVFGEIALLDGGPRTADASAQTDCILMFLDRRDFTPLLIQYPEIALRILKVVCKRLRRTTKQVESLGLRGVQARLASTLLDLADIQGFTYSTQPKIRITQKELGNMLGLSRESTNRHLREWENAGLLALEKGVCIILNPKRLANLYREKAE